jgi:Flp pilus assembly protein CpaB
MRRLFCVVVLALCAACAAACAPNAPLPTVAVLPTLTASITPSITPSTTPSPTHTATPTSVAATATPTVAATALFVATQTPNADSAATTENTSTTNAISATSAPAVLPTYAPNVDVFAITALPAPRMIEILLPSRPLPAGVLLQDGDWRAAPWPAEAVPLGALRPDDADLARGRVAAIAFPCGQPLQAALLIEGVGGSSSGSECPPLSFGATVDVIEVVVIVRPVPSGAVLGEDDVALRPFPVVLLPASAILRGEEAIDRRAMSDLAVGQMVTREVLGEIAPANDGDADG